jgi:hypothetical protein
VVNLFYFFTTKALIRTQRTPKKGLSASAIKNSS